MKETFDRMIDLEILENRQRSIRFSESQVKVLESLSRKSKMSFSAVVRVVLRVFLDNEEEIQKTHIQKKMSERESTILHPIRIYAYQGKRLTELSKQTGLSVSYIIRYMIDEILQ
ncbi:TPA: hypothetical protein U2D29_001341 [Streptococcus suis]|uniref:hypothetical protein n=1 Tax=Streptococcus suis TaxID=1307 RepID=UPI000CA108A8|nr:hypothetical protein [Streptococcus suis]AUC92723.1 hypothetical protein CWM22_12890 [Streptococcus suis]MDX4991565.1 hypothetical protein [Streptococcus suis]NQL53268.1 hypothetical protein [Streptococcus suis]NQL60363.1 hypothetical protein [Streptococcus suis]NQM23667.1 hypothetical protein [Streptococcus suis]